MANNINPRYLSYSKDEVQAILDQVETLDDAPVAGSDNPVKSGGVAGALGDYFNKETDIANEEDVRSIVSNYTPSPDSSDSE